MVNILQSQTFDMLYENYSTKSKKDFHYQDIINKYKSDKNRYDKINDIKSEIRNLYDAEFITSDPRISETRFDNGDINDTFTLTSKCKKIMDKRMFKEWMGNK